jgi:LysR family transcriptional regulator, nitrogen assimilation regulatory protein
MAFNLKILRSFVTAVDCASLSAAARLLELAQPALSQQIASMERHFGQQLLNRSALGVTPTVAGEVLYRHSVLMLEQWEQAERDIFLSGEVEGVVSIGLATYSAISFIATPLIQRVRAQYPRVQLYINDSFGVVLSELVMNGQMDMAVIYAPDQMRGVTLEALWVESLYLIAPPQSNLPPSDDGTISLTTLASLASIDLLLPGRAHYLRRLVDNAFARANLPSRIRAEIESVNTLRDAIQHGIGATILPLALVHEFQGLSAFQVRRLVEPELKVTVSLCTAERSLHSSVAKSIRECLLQIANELLTSGKQTGLSRA